MATKIDGSVGIKGVFLGAVSHFLATSIPAGWIKADGSNVSRASYPDLFALIGTTYGAGDGSTTFTLPDLRGEFIRSADEGRGVDPGRALGSPQTHSTEDLYTKIYPSGTIIRTDTVPTPPWTSDTQSSATGTATSAAGLTTGASVGTMGTGETRPRNIALLACIRYV